ncbi:E3 ubiquitin-protein ligase MARCH5 [Drosophila busckii]|uniref:E3 ubiquitin-protein ligase MARCH5 n=1 Tax=Drosophila busckii TaxID=30019 RepID=UPI001432DA5A|nr:E3 ubiquitin-protein ligase MARCH5 [Drosophila busckii]
MAEATSGHRESERTCWICFATESENRLAVWRHPCQCRGSTKWVHESCLYRWIDEKQNGNSRMKVTCMQCRVEYLIIFPQAGAFTMLLERAQDVIRQCSPFVAASAFLGSIYWTAVTFGGITVLQVLGQQRGMELIERGDPFFLLVGLPFIPVGLILSRLIRWEEALLRPSPPARPPHCYLSSRWCRRPADFARIFCGAILLPSISMLVGNLLYSKKAASPLQRTLLGGFTFIALKGILKIYMRQRQYLHKSRRHIVDYTEENVRQYAPPATPSTQASRQFAGRDEQEAAVAAVATETLTPTQDAEDVRQQLVVSVPDCPYTLLIS